MRADGLLGIREDPLTGYTPMHAVAACGLPDMFDYLLQVHAVGLPLIATDCLELQLHAIWMPLTAIDCH